MMTRTLGTTDLVVSRIGLGSNNFGTRLDYAGTEEVVNAALDAGITFIDTADVYGAGQAEEYLGRLLQGRRDEIVLATKFGGQGDPTQRYGSPGYIRSAIEGSLRRLRTDRVDLYWMHKPDPVVPIEDTLGALGELVGEGKVRAIGSCNLTGSQVAHAEWVARTRETSGSRVRFAATQNDYSLLDRAPELDLANACRFYDIGFICYQPLAQGLLTGKYRANVAPPAGSRLLELPGALQDADYGAIEALEGFAQSRGISLIELSIGYLLAQPAVTSIVVGATSAGQIRTNAGVRWAPSAEDISEIRSLLGFIRAVDWPTDHALNRSAF